MNKKSRNEKLALVEDDLEQVVMPTPKELAAQRAGRRKKASEEVLQYFTKSPPQNDFVWRGFLRQTVGAIVAAGSTGKSFWALEAAMCVASAKANESLLQLDIPKHGRVAIFNAEDPPAMVWARIHAIAQFLDRETMQEVAENIELVPLFGREKTDMNDPVFVRDMLEFAHDCRLVIFDTLNRFAGSADENSNGEMGLLLKSFEYIAAHAGPAVLLVHHSSKAASFSGQQDKQESARGASSITSNLRWQGYMQGLTEDEAPQYGIELEDRSQFVRFGGSKENYGAKTKEQWYQRREHGVLIPCDLFKGKPSTMGHKPKKAVKKGG